MSLVVYDTATGRAKRLHDGTARSLQKARDRLSDGEACIEGDFKSITGKRVQDGALVDIEPTADDAMRALRSTRDKLLRAHVDAMNPVWWDAMPPAQRDAWRDYRQALLDLPAVTTDPFNPAWPERPA